MASKTVLIQILLDPEMAEWVLQQAKHEGLTKTSWLRHVLTKLKREMRDE